MKTLPSRAILACLAFLTACRASGYATDPAPQEEFSDPQRVAILGYTGDAMEPFLSVDGLTLFFNNRIDGSVQTDLHHASRVDGLTFEYRGPVAGANSTALDAVASMDGAGRLYFISLRSYDTTLSTIYRGDWSSGALSNVEQVKGIPSSGPGNVIFDAGISADGQTLCFAEGDYSSGTLTTASLVMAERNATGFSRSPLSATTLQEVNRAGSTLYAPAFSASGLDLYFTRLVGFSATILVASRPNLTSPFGPARVIAAITGFVEAPTVSADGKSLYYHARLGNQFVLYRVTRP